MPATLARLVQVRSRLAGEVLAYLDALARRAAELPPYYPPALRHVAADEPPFDAVRQKVQVVEDRTAFERWGAEERERARAAGDEDAAVPAPPPPPPPPIPWDERAGERFKRAIILGDPGFGKTWLLRYEARRLARQAARQLRDYAIPLDDLVLPFFLRLSDLNRSDDPLEDALVRLVGQGRSAAFAQFIRDTLTTGRCVLLLDGWDEVPVETPPPGQPIRYRPGFRQRLEQRLDEFVRAFPPCRLLLTSRIVGYTGSPIPDAQELELLAFDTPQIEAFVRAWFGQDEERAGQFLGMLRGNPQVHGLARIPLMLALMCRAYLEEQLTFPTRRVDLYDRCLRGLLRDWKEEKEQRPISDAYVEALLELLETVGYALFVEGYEQFGEAQVRQVMLPWLRDLPSSHELYGCQAAALIDQLKRDGVFIRAGEHGGAPLLFLHRTFHEYLAASALARRANAEGWGAIAALVDKRAWLPAWQEVIILLAGKLEEPTPLLHMLAGPDPTPTNPHGDDLFRHRLALAALCLPELTSQSRYERQALVDQITAAAFSLWWQHRLDGTADAVPHFTHVLPALGRIGDARALERLLALTQDADRDVRRAAAEALERIGDARALEGLLALTQDADRDVRWAAAVALGRIGDARALERLLAQAGIRLFANAEFRRVTDLARDG